MCVRERVPHWGVLAAVAVWLGLEMLQRTSSKSLSSYTNRMAWSSGTCLGASSFRGRCRVQGAESRVQGAGFRVQSAGERVCERETESERERERVCVCVSKREREREQVVVVVHESNGVVLRNVLGRLLLPRPLQGAGCRVQSSGFRVQDSGFRIQGSGFRVQGAGLGFRIQGSGFKVEPSSPRLAVPCRSPGRVWVPPPFADAVMGGLNIVSSRC